MAGRGRASFQKRQKEQLRMERRQQKAARKSERNTNKGEGPEIEEAPETDEPLDDILAAAEDLNPAGGLRIPRSE